MRDVIGICTDSGSQLPPALVASLSAAGVPIEVVPLTVTIDDIDHLDTLDVCADRYYASGAPPVVVTPPSPGQFAGAFDDLVARGCTSIISLHGATDVLGTSNAARLAARSIERPVKVVDIGAPGVGVGCSVWAVADALACGASSDEATSVVDVLSPSISTMHVVPGVDIHAARNIAAAALGQHRRVRIAVAFSDAASSRIADSLEVALRSEATAAGVGIVEVASFRLGPSAGAYAVPGVAGCVVFTAP